MERLMDLLASQQEGQIRLVQMQADLQNHTLQQEEFAERRLRQEDRQREAQQRTQQLQETLQAPIYDGTTDVEDFIDLFSHLAHRLDWPHDLYVLKLKTSLTGQAAECGRPGDIAEIYTALRARFGITAAEAKRRLLAMKSGQTDGLRKLADNIKKLTDLAYPDVAQGARATLALDQFKRCVSTDLSIFMVSRPPLSLNEAVQICGEYTSAGARLKNKHSLAAMEMNSRGDGEMVEQDRRGMPLVHAAVTEENTRPVSSNEVRELLSAFEHTLTRCLKEMVAVCADAIRSEVTTSTPPLQPQRQPRRATPGSTKPKLPPSPCSRCKQMHWYKDCPVRKADLQHKKSGNFNGPRQ